MFILRPWLAQAVGREPPVHRQGENWARLSRTDSLEPVWCFTLQDLFVPPAAAAAAAPAPAAAAEAAWFSFAP